MKEFRLNRRLMGSSFTLGVVSQSKKQAQKLLQLGIKEIKRIEYLLSEFLPLSETTKINQQSSLQAIKIKKECFDLLLRCNHISKLTEGDFDITVSPLKHLYQFKNDVFLFPEKQIIKETLQSVGYQKIELDTKNQSVFLSHPKSKISFAAIGKGYASDRVKKLWMDKGLTSGYINASGDLNAFGKRADGSPWNIGISNPDNIDEILLSIPIQNASVATSGDYEQHFIHQGKRYSHNINPHTGLPISSLKSITIFSPSAELSDALATAVYVKGIKKGINFVNQLPNTHCILIDEKNKIHLSDKLKYEKINP